MSKRKKTDNPQQEKLSALRRKVTEVHSDICDDAKDLVNYIRNQNGRLIKAIKDDQQEPGNSSESVAQSA